MEKIRRVIAGIDKDGRSKVMSDEIVEAYSPPTLGTQIIDVHGADKPLVVPFDGMPESGLKFFPSSLGAYRFIIFTYPPRSHEVEHRTDEASRLESERLAPGINEVISHGGGLHATSTVDLEYILSGEIVLNVGDERVELKAGDCVVQCGEMHSWVNESDQPATVLCIFLGANLDMSRFPKSE